MTWADEQIQMIDDCINRERSLSDWESDFIYDLKLRSETSTPPSPLQIQKLDEIWERVT